MCKCKYTHTKCYEWTTLIRIISIIGIVLPHVSMQCMQRQRDIVFPILSVCLSVQCQYVFKRMDLSSHFSEVR